MKSIYGLEIIANIELNKVISKIGEKIYRLLYKTYFRTLHLVLSRFSLFMFKHSETGQSPSTDVCSQVFHQNI